MAKREKPPTLESVASEIEQSAPIARDDIPPLATDAPGSSPSASAPASSAAPGALTDATIGALDRLGRSFDPKLHQAGADGKPIITKRGQLAIKGGRTPGGSGTGSLAPSLPGIEAQRAAELARFRSTAQVTVSTIVGLAAQFGGEAWSATPNENGAMVDAWTKYYELRGIRDVPPEVMIAVVMGAWAVGSPARREQLKSAALTLRARFVDARANRWTNGGGQEHAGAPSDRELPGAPVDRS